MTDEPFEVKAARALVEQLREREAVLAPAVDELARVRELLKDADRVLQKALKRARLSELPKREPADGTEAAAVLAVLRGSDEPVSLGVIVSRSRVPARHASVTLTRVCERGLARRVGDGRYEAVTRAD